MKTLFIYNPNAGMKQIKNNLWDILNVLSDSDLTVYASKKNLDIYNYIKNNGDKFEHIIISGGDGSLNEAVNGLMKLDNMPTIGYIPAGSTNDFAYSLKLNKNMKEASDIALNGKTISSIDIGQFNNKYFIYVAAFGSLATVSYSTSQRAKNMIGHLAYLLNGIDSIKDLKSYKMKIKTDDNTYEDEYVLGMISNSLSIGGVYHLNSKDVKLDDGLFEVLLIKKPKDLIELAIIGDELLHNHIRSNNIISFKTNSLSISSEEKIAWSLDGEFGGEVNKAKIKNLNKIINIKTK